MKSPSGIRRFLLPPGLLAIAFLAGASVMAAPTNIFSTQFEAWEGYSTNFDLIGQNGWLGFGSGGNGIVNQFITGEGQQAYLGFTAPAAGYDQLGAWPPLNFDPLAAHRELVRYSVLMNISDSMNASWDNFRWSVYNPQGHRFFSLDFDNFYADVSYLLDGTNTLVITDIPYTPGSNYTLLVTMNFASNRWSATLDKALIATNQPITTTNATLALGDIDAVWLIYDTNAPGDNFMLFDNYRVTAESLPVPPARMEFLGRSVEGWTLLRVFALTGSRWAVEATTNLLDWTALKTNVVSDLAFDLVDTTAAGSKQRFYRARSVP